MMISKPKISDNCWRGRDVYIIGGGPSLTGFNWECLKGKTVIAINRAYEFCLDYTSILLGMDKQFWRGILGLPDGLIFDDSKKCKELVESRVVKVWVKTQGDSSEIINDFHNMMVIPCAGKNTLTTKLLDGLGTGGNSGYCTMNLALVLGARRIFLLGFDMMTCDDENQTHFHSGYSKVQKSHVNKGFVDHFNQLKYPFADFPEVEVFNVQDDEDKTALKKFPIVSFEWTFPEIDNTFIYGGRCNMITMRVTKSINDLIKAVKVSVFAEDFELMSTFIPYGLFRKNVSVEILKRVMEEGCTVSVELGYDTEQESEKDA